jgi:hypothetical protein
MIQEFKKYRRKSVSEMRQVIFGEDLTGVSISEPDKKLMQENPNVFAQGYIARNPKNHEDLWYVAKEYFDDNLEAENVKLDTIENYSIATANSAYELSEIVNDLIKAGWQIIDGHKTLYLQNNHPFKSREYSQTLVYFPKK